MFAVLKSDSGDVAKDRKYCCHLSDDKKSADDFIADRKALSGSGTYAVAEVKTLPELLRLIMPPQEEVDPLADLMQKLEKAGLTTVENVDKAVQEIQQRGEQAVAEVRSMGIRSMKAIGDGFMAFGDLLKKAAAEDDK